MQSLDNSAENKIRYSTLAKHDLLRQFKVLFVYPNLYMMNMMPPAISVMSALLKQKGFGVTLFDTTYYPWDHANAVVSGQGVGRFDMSSDKRKELTLQVRPFDLQERGIH